MIRQNRVNIRDHFDDMIVGIDSKLFDVQMLMSDFVIALIRAFPENSATVDIQIPKIRDDAISFQRVFLIRLENEQEPRILLHGDTVMQWHELDIASQYVVVNHLHAKHISDSMYRHLSENSPR